MSNGLTDPARLDRYKFSIPFVGELEWVPDDRQRHAAWELYVELATRIAVHPLDLNDGVLREALSSLHSLFATTRQILRSAGPGVGAQRETVGGIAITVLNKGIRPFLSKWHPALHAYELQRPSHTSPKNWERQWAEETSLRGELDILSQELGEYAKTLARMAGVAP